MLDDGATGRQMVQDGVFINDFERMFLGIIGSLDRPITWTFENRIELVKLKKAIFRREHLYQGNLGSDIFIDLYGEAKEGDWSAVGSTLSWSPKTKKLATGSDRIRGTLKEVWQKNR
jgi:hypothetical protein